MLSVLTVARDSIRFARDPLAFLLAKSRERNDLPSFQVGPTRMFLAATPAAAHAVLFDNSDKYDRSTPVFDTMKRFLGSGILTTEGEHWRRHRRIVQPAFHRRRLQSFGVSMTRATEEMLASWRGRSEVDMADEMMRLTLRIVGETLLGTDTQAVAEEIGRSIDIAQRHTEWVIRRSIVLPEWLPTKRNREFRACVEQLDRIAYRLIDERTEQIRRDGSGGNDVLSMLVEARDERGEPLPRKQIRDELLTLISAGHETTANALAWTFSLLSQHPSVLRRLRVELDAVLEGRTATVDDVGRLEYTRWVFDEAMRIRPPVWTTARRVAQSHDLCGARVEPDDIVMVSPLVLHRRPDVFPNPEGFDPDRWAALSAPGALPACAFIPFGAGARKCVGEALAYLEAVLILATVVPRVDLDLLPGHPPVAHPQITLGLRFGLPMRPRWRNREQQPEHAVSQLT